MIERCSVWRQNGPLAASGALFLAVSNEENLHKHHTISRDGYNVGRSAIFLAMSTDVQTRGLFNIQLQFWWGTVTGIDWWVTPHTVPDRSATRGIQPRLNT